MTTSKKDTTSTRRRFLKVAAAGAAATVAAPAVVARARSACARQSTWPSKDPFPRIAPERQEGQRYDRWRPQDRGVAGRRRRTPSVCSMRSRKACSTAAIAYWSSLRKPTALALWGSGPALPWTPTCCCPGARYGGGKELLANSINDQRQPGFVPLRADADAGVRLNRADRQGRRHQGPERAVGISIDVFTAIGAARQRAARRRNRLRHGSRPARRDQFNNATSDLSFPRRLQGLHAARAITRTPSSSKSCSTTSTPRCRRR